MSKTILDAALDDLSIDNAGSHGESRLFLVALVHDESFLSIIKGNVPTTPTILHVAKSSKGLSADRPLGVAAVVECWNDDVIWEDEHSADIQVPRLAGLIDIQRLIREHGADIDLKFADLRGADLRGANLAGANLEGADLRGADLSRGNLQYAWLLEANLQRVDFTRANLFGAQLKNTDLRRATLREAELRHTTWKGVSLRGAELWAANLRGVDLSDCFLEGVDLTRADTRGNP